MCDHNEFHLFPRLPAEIRIRIWLFALPPPRIVEVRCGSDSISNFSPKHNNPHHSHGPGAPICTIESLFGEMVAGCLSSARLPVTLSINRESRAETLRHYRPMFGFAGQPGRVFFDPYRDVLYFGPRGRDRGTGSTGLMRPPAQFRTVVALCEPGDLAQVRRVAVDEAVLGHVGSHHHHRRGQHSDHERFVAAVHGTYQLLEQHVATRLPELEELVFVSEGAKRRFDPAREVVEPSGEALLDASMVGAVGLAMREMERTMPCWRPPAWNVFSRKSFG